MASFRAFLNSPVGPKTTHFWGPVANWGFVAAVCSWLLDSLAFLLSVDIEFFVCLADDMITIEFFAKWVLKYAAIQMNVHVFF